VASVLVPFPYAVDDHQTANGRFLADGGAAVLIPQRDLSAAGLATLIAGFTRDRLLDMARLARGLGRADAARRVADVCQQLAVA
jgi:UDP-N-acetylglucosamine--N-acetylmuramyl-(pentapeptide) pyrophosphoryl-undecaprenol N-acetylglucosamine transferase